MKQTQFLEVLDRDEAEQRWRVVVGRDSLEAETVSLDVALGRVLAEDVRATVDVPGFDRSNMDGFAVRAEDTFGVSEEEPVRLRLNDEILATGILPGIEVEAGTATTIATGGMLPRGADAVAPIEVTDADPADPAFVFVRAPRVPGAAVSFAGTDMCMHESHTPRTTNFGLPMCSRARSTYASRRLKSCFQPPPGCLIQRTMVCSLPK